MRLITCCPACGTKFRVVADQLRISDGWVRCGRCQEIFDASQALEEIPSEASAAVAARADVPTSDPDVDAAESVSQSAETAELARGDRALPDPEPISSTGYELPAPPEDTEETWLDAPVDVDDEIWKSGSIAQRMESVRESNEADPEEALTAKEPAVEPPLGAASALPEDEESVWEAEAQRSKDPALDESGHPEADAAADTLRHADLVVDEQEGVEPPSSEMVKGIPLPSFVKQAQRKAWWSKPVVRFVTALGVIVLFMALLLQIALHERNTLVAWKPQWRASFESLCAVMRCELAPRKHIASVLVTGSSFTHDARPNHYRLDISIHNQSALSVATPAVELTLTDGQNQVLVRKVLDLTEIGAPAELAARSEWNGTLPVMTQGLNLPVSGYRVTAFYP